MNPSQPNPHRLHFWLRLSAVGLIFLTLGYVGNQWLASCWRQSQAAEFLKSHEVLAQLVALRSWPDPPESDPLWHSLEQSANVDLVPLARAASQSGTHAGSIQWQRSPSGNWQAIVTLPVPMPVTLPVPLKDASAIPSPTSIAAIQATRQFDGDPVAIVWWSTWLISFASLVGLLWSTGRRRSELDLTRVTEEPPRDESPSVPNLNLLTRISEGILVVDASGSIVTINPTMCRQLNLPFDGLEQRKLVEAVRVPRVVELVEHVMRTSDTSEQTIEIGDEPRTLRLVATPIANARPTESNSSATSDVLLTAVDVSETQRSELARREFITGASHELKTPLAAIRAYTETLQSIGDDDPETQKHFLQRILDQADRMDRLVTSMLQLARAESGTLKLKLERIDVALAIRPCIDAARSLAQSKKLTLTTNVPDQQLLAQADHDALQTIASNLLSNAVRYTPEGGTIEVSLTAVPAANGSDAAIVLRVTDTGIGIAPADQERIFERFYRVQKDRGLDSGGTGLGLAIVKQLTQVLNGTVTVTSRKGEGTCFEIRLPAVGFTQSSS